MILDKEECEERRVHWPRGRRRKDQHNYMYTQVYIGVVVTLILLTLLFDVRFGA